MDIDAEGGQNQRMTTLVFLLLLITAGVVWWRIADTAPDYSRWNGGVPEDSDSSPRFVHNETHRWA